MNTVHQLCPHTPRPKLSGKLLLSKSELVSVMLVRDSRTWQEALVLMKKDLSKVNQDMLLPNQRTHEQLLIIDQEELYEKQTSCVL